MRRDLVDERECGGRFHVAVTATLTMLAKVIVVGKKRDGILRCEFENVAKRVVPHVQCEVTGDR